MFFFGRVLPIPTRIVFMKEKKKKKNKGYGNA